MTGLIPDRSGFDLSYPLAFRAVRIQFGADPAYDAIVWQLARRERATPAAILERIACVAAVAALVRDRRTAKEKA